MARGLREGGRSTSADNPAPRGSVGTPATPVTATTLGTSVTPDTPVTPETPDTPETPGTPRTPKTPMTATGARISATPTATNGLRPEEAVAPNPLSYRVIARDGVKLRSGPGTEFQVIRSLPFGTPLDIIRRDGLWALVDLQGDGAADGHVHASYLEEVQTSAVATPEA
jgi:uncharacterized protein YgiM (DUF1202 family)